MSLLQTGELYMKSLPSTSLIASLVHVPAEQLPRRSDSSHCKWILLCHRQGNEMGKKIVSRLRPLLGLDVESAPELAYLMATVQRNRFISTVLHVMGCSLQPVVWPGSLEVKGTGPTD